jgi:hypothetical protein
MVMRSPDHFKAREETAYLLRSPANVKRLLTAIEALQAGKGKEHSLRHILAAAGQAHGEADQSTYRERYARAIHRR